MSMLILCALAPIIVPIRPRTDDAMKNLGKVSLATKTTLRSCSPSPSEDIRKTTNKGEADSEACGP